ncbi:MAG TPA: UDP-N-acetylmuramate--L-alanine ligase [Gemmatimonadota bacterium]|nr:UDP-N-acetylmuramate--L-alanine ligase [Gemmatimonadota bacterium]
MTEPRLARPSDLPPAGGSVFFLGLAGAGMRALVPALMARGCTVAGSDREIAAAADLEALGVDVHRETELEPVRAADLVIYSSALPEDHPALAAARAAGVPTLKRARALGALVNDRRLAAVAGTHGKTTVTTMLAVAVERAGLDPLAFVGGRVGSWGGNSRIGAGNLAVVEADEYDRSFLELDPDLAIVTSVEPEHLDTYGDAASLEAAFVEFVSRAARVLLCADDEGALRLAPSVRSPAEVRTYGFAAESTWRLEVLDAGRAGQSCRLHGPDEAVPFRVGAPGAHNAQNAAAALAAAIWLGADRAALATALEDFRGADRRLQVLHEDADLVVVDDYAHHPTEVRAGMEALRSAWPGRRLIVVFQPHLYTRTRDQAAGFADALARADRALVLPIYPAREAPIAGVTRELILGARRGLEPLEPDQVDGLVRVDRPSVLAFMGAGDVTRLAHDAARAAHAGHPDALGG